MREDWGIALRQESKQHQSGACPRELAAKTVLMRFEASLQEGLRLQEAGRLDDACACYSKVLGAEPTNSEALRLLGLIFVQRGALQSGITLLRKSVAADVCSAQAFRDLALASSKLRLWDEAVTAWRKTIELSPSDAALWNDLGVTLLQAERRQEAQAAFHQAIKLNAALVEAHNNLGVALLHSGEFERSIAAFREAIAHRPDYTDAHRNLGNALVAVGDLNAAVEACQRAVELDPDGAIARTNLGHAFQARNEFDRARRSYVEAVRLNPNLPQARLNLATLQLLTGDFESGWQNYEYREGLVRERRIFQQPRWLGDGPIQGKSIFVYAEQGLGDTIQFVRYVKLLAESGATVHLEVQPPLRSLLRNTAGASSVLAQGDQLPPCDLQCPLLSLPLAFKTTINSVPATVPYLTAESELRSAWSDRLSHDRALRVGLVWAGSRIFRKDRQRSIPLATLEHLLDTPGCRFYSVQKELDPHDAAVLARHAVVDLSSELADFGVTAAVVSALDLVITVDTAVAHLAGALGCKTWILLPFAPDWRWLLDREDSPWYPTVRLLRQSHPGDWGDVISRVGEGLCALL